MPKGKGSYSERLQYQLKFQISRTHAKTAAQAEALKKRAAKQFLKDGSTIDGVKITARWRNPDNKNIRHANWKSTDDPGQSLADFFQTLHKGRGALRAFEDRYS